MAFERIEELDYILSLSDRPNDKDGMTAAELKARFDQGVADIKEYINDVLLPALEEGGAGEIGIEEITGVEVDDEDNVGETRPAANLQEALEALKEAVDAAALGDIPDSSLTDAKLADAAVTTAKLADGAVSTAKLAALAVTAAKIAAGAVETAKIASRAVTGAKIALAAIVNEHLGSKAVKQANIDDAAVGTAQLINGAVTYAKTSGVQKKHTDITMGGNGYITLAAANWNSSTKRQTVNVSGVTSGSKVDIGPWVAESSAGTTNWERVRDYGIRCIGHGNGTLTFECETIPTGVVYFVGYVLD